MVVISLVPECPSQSVTSVAAMDERIQVSEEEVGPQFGRELTSRIVNSKIMLRVFRARRFMVIREDILTNSFVECHQR